MALDDERFFYRTGRRPGSVLRPVEAVPHRPALFAQLSDLTAIRYDFPIVLIDRPGDRRWIEPLSSLIDVTIAEVAPSGASGERFRRTVLRLEREMRAIIAGQGPGLGPTDRPGPMPLPALEDLWRAAVERLAITGGEPARAEADRARIALQARGLFEGSVADCDQAAAASIIGHAWAWVEARKSEAMARRIETLRLTLENLVKADYLRSGAGRGAVSLAAGVGAADRGLFDFEVMAGLLAKPSGPSALPAARRRRIDETLAVLRDQPFFGAGALDHRFERTDEALAAWRARQPLMAELVRAIAIAELEASGSYSEARHDDFFASFEPGLVSDEERVVFPDYLVTLSANAGDQAGRSQVLEALAGDAPIKILLETGDPFGLGGQLATTAMGLGNVYVLQTPSSHLYTVRDQIRAALEFSGPALISVFSGSFGGSRAAGDGDDDRAHDALPPYLVAAAALESRTFPAFAYDPSAGSGWADRLTLLDNPQADRPWPVHELRYADDQLTRTTERVAFTPIDLALCDPSRARHFAAVPREHWSGLISAGDWLHGEAGNGAAPFVPAVGADGCLARLAADEGLVREAKRVAEAWQRLLQLDELKHEKVVIVERPPDSAGTVEATGVVGAGAADSTTIRVPAAAGSTLGTTAAAGPSEAMTGAVAPVAAEPERDPDEAYIETWRCTTCNECTNVNSRMFAYNENRQAYIKDVTAGTYRDLVNAAESCQVAIIHPGKPRDPGESGLDELLERAQPFL